MIIYYSLGGTTRQYAEVLSELLNEPAIELKEKNSRAGIFGKAMGAIEAVFNLPVALEDLPDIPPGRVLFICSPVWAGGLTPAVNTFLKSTGAGKRKANVILTCSSVLNHDRYKKKVIEQLILRHCAPGFVQVFSGKAEPDREVLRKQLKKLVLKVDESF